MRSTYHTRICKSNRVDSSAGEDKGALEDLYEPFLVQAGFLVRTPRGRAATPQAYRHLGLPGPLGMEQKALE